MPVFLKPCKNGEINDLVCVWGGGEGVETNRFRLVVSEAGLEGINMLDYLP